MITSGLYALLKNTANLQAQHERELKQLKTELLEMKKQRVKMLNKMRSEASKLMDVCRT